jgi:DNA-binding LacI/PurR family transcriptional regulator
LHKGIALTSRNKTQMITAQDVAARAGVSRAAVSRTLSNQGSVSEKTREKVLKAAKELGYQVNYLAQGLNRKRSMLIGVVVTRISDPFRSSLLESLLIAIQDRGFQALVTEVKAETELESTIRRFTQYRVSGVLITSGQPPSKLAEECVHYNIPVVVINRTTSIPNVDIVCSDNRQGAELVAHHLLSAGCRKLGWLNAGHSTWSGLDRGISFQQVLENLQPSPHLTILKAPSAGYEGGRQAAFTHHFRHDPVDGIYCANSQLACGFWDGMREQGFEAPRDFQLIGFDNTFLTSQDSYHLSTVSQDIATLAHEALDCLELRTRHPDRPQTIKKIPVDLLLRSSSPTIRSASE